MNSWLNLLLKLGAVVLALLMAAVILARQSGFGIGIRQANNMFTDLGNTSVASWLIVVLVLLEIMTLVLLVVSRKFDKSA